MKKLFSLLLAFLILFSCHAFAEELTGDALVQAAKEEIGDNTLLVYSPSSRHSKSAADFQAKYGIKVEVTVLKDNEMIEKVSTEIKNNVVGADLVFAQNGGRVFAELMEPGYVSSFTPVSLRNSIDTRFQNPQVWNIPIKVFIYNNGENFGTESPISNVWALTDPEWKGRFQFKDPNNEGVNMNFFTMCVKDEWAEKLTEAYKSHYGKDIELTTPNAGYEWIKGLYENGMVMGTSDTKIAEQVGAKNQDKQLMGLFTINKTRASKDKELDLAAALNLEPFSGFGYAVYVLIPNNCKYPNTAKLFEEYMLNPEGFKYWSEEIGDYSPNPAIVNAEDPTTLEEWTKVLVMEDPEWCANHRWEVEEFITALQ